MYFIKALHFSALNNNWWVNLPTNYCLMYYLSKTYTLLVKAYQIILAYTAWKIIDIIDLQCHIT